MIPGIGGRENVVAALCTVGHLTGIAVKFSARVRAGIGSREGVIPAMAGVGHGIGIAVKFSARGVAGIGGREGVIPAVSAFLHIKGIAVERVVTSKAIDGLVPSSVGQRATSVSAPSVPLMILELIGLGIAVSTHKIAAVALPAPPQPRKAEL